MLVLVDTGVLLRAHDAKDPMHDLVLRALTRIQAGDHTLVTTTQNLREFWNVATRPTAARGGLGRDTSEVHEKIGIIERLFQVVPELPTTFARWKSLVNTHRVQGAKFTMPTLSPCTKSIEWTDCSR